MAGRTRSLTFVLDFGFRKNASISTSAKRKYVVVTKGAVCGYNRRVCTMYTYTGILC